MISNWLARFAGACATILLPATAVLAQSPAQNTQIPTSSAAAPTLPEWIIKIHEIATGDPRKPGASPLVLSKTRFGWPAVARNHGVPMSGSVTKSQYQGSPQRFDQLDRDKDGVLKASDFDWSDQAPFVQQQAMAAALFNRMNVDGDGFISPEELKKSIDRLAGSSGKLTQDDVRRLMFTGPPLVTTPNPTRAMRLFGFLTGELGSMSEGPNPGTMAPDFQLKTQDEKRTVKLSDFRGIKPVVLIFGNFT